MALTLLLDLDDTLLANRIDVFMQAYLKALGSHLSSRFRPDTLIRSLLEATGQMIDNQDPALTLEETFDRAFYPALGVERSAVQAEIDRFYSQIFPSLQHLTSPRPEAIDLVQQAFARGWRVVIATNPLFPRTAIHQRLAWAGLDPVVYPFDLVTSYETCHFAKPNPAFYAEVLAQIGWPDQPAVMLGNSLEDDIAPAARLGLATYLVDPIEPGFAQSPLHSRGSLSDALGWLDQLDQGAPPPEATHPDALITTLRAVPAGLASLGRRFSSADWTHPPQPGEWSFTQILCHLRDVEAQVDLLRIQQVLREDNPFISAMVTDVWAAERRYDLQDGAQALVKYTATRKLVLDLLTGLSPTQWGRPARHSIFGPTDLKELVQFIATHDKTHVRQAYQALNALLPVKTR